MAAMGFAPPLQLQTSLDKRLQHFTIEWFLNEIKRRTLDRPDQLLVEVIDAARHQDDVDFRKTRLQSRHQLEAVDVGHSDVDNRQLG